MSQDKYGGKVYIKKMHINVRTSSSLNEMMSFALVLPAPVLLFMERRKVSLWQLLQSPCVCTK